MNTIYKVKWGWLVVIITITVSLIVVWLNVQLVFSLLNSENYISRGIILVIFNSVIGITVLQTPRFVKTCDKKILLKKIYGKFEINYSEIQAVAPFNPGLSLRVFGSGGFLGFLGIFSSEKYGWYKSYIGNAKQSFLIITKNNKKYVFSCENSEEVIRTIKQHIENAEKQP